MIKALNNFRLKNEIFTNIQLILFYYYFLCKFSLCILFIRNSIYIFITQIIKLGYLYEIKISNLIINYYK